MVNKLDHQSIIPLYHQLKEILKKNIASGLWSPLDKIPSENQLMKEYTVSRNTIKKALGDLVQEGMLKRIQGKGTFVSIPKFEQSLSKFYSFSSVMKEKGLNPKDIILSIEKIKVKADVAKILQLNEGEPVFELRRLRCAQDTPIILERSYIPCKYIEHIDKEMLEKKSLYEFMQEEFGVYVTKAREIFEPVLVNSYDSQYLKVKEGYPALLLERIAYDSHGNPVEFCCSIVRGDSCRFYTELL